MIRLCRRQLGRVTDQPVGARSMAASSGFLVGIAIDLSPYSGQRRDPGRWPCFGEHELHAAVPRHALREMPGSTPMRAIFLSRPAAAGRFRGDAVGAGSDASQGSKWDVRRPFVDGIDEQLLDEANDWRIVDFGRVVLWRGVSAAGLRPRRHPCRTLRRSVPLRVVEADRGCSSRVRQVWEP